MRISDWSSDVCSSDLIHALLCAPGERRGISDLAYAHGFTSAAHFSRAFRNLFGYSARDVRDLARMRTIPRSRQAATSVEAWLNRLQSHCLLAHRRRPAARAIPTCGESDKRREGEQVSIKVR